MLGFKFLRLSVGALQSRVASLRAEREAFEQKMREGATEVRGDLADARAARLDTIASLNAEVVALQEIERNLA